MILSPPQNDLARHEARADTLLASVPRAPGMPRVSSAGSGPILNRFARFSHPAREAFRGRSCRIETETFRGGTALRERKTEELARRQVAGLLGPDQQLVLGVDEGLAA